MKAHLNHIRQLLNELEVQADSESVQNGDRDFAAAELPLIIQEIVDDLQPLLTPYEAAFYWYAFRHSIASNGSPLLRISTRGLQAGVVKSSRGEKSALGHVRGVLAALESLGAIRKEGEPNNPRRN